MADFPEYAPPPPEVPEVSQPEPIQEVVEPAPPPPEVSQPEPPMIEAPEPTVIEAPEPIIVETPEPPISEEPESPEPSPAPEIPEPLLMEELEPPAPPEPPEIPEPPVAEEPEIPELPSTPEASEPAPMEEPEAPEPLALETSEPPVDYDSVRDAYLQNIDDQRLSNHADALYRPGASIGDGGTAAALLHEKETGELVNGKSHETKSLERERGIDKRINEEGVSVTDQELGKEMQEDLQIALNAEKKNLS